MSHKIYRKYEHYVYSCMFLKFAESEVEGTDGKKDEMPPAAIVQLPQDLVQLLLPQKPVKIGMEISYCLCFEHEYILNMELSLVRFKFSCNIIYIV